MADDGIRAETESIVPEVINRSTKVEHAAGPVYVGRIANCLLEVPNSIERSSSGDIERAIRQALKDDPRVSEVVDLESEDRDNTRLFWFYDFDSTDIEDVRAQDGDEIEPLNRYKVLRLERSIDFVVRVPAKNQPRYRNISDVPSDTYQVWWTGLVLAVAWRQEGPRATASGGHVVFDIISDVVAAAGYRTRLQACTPSCTHGFLHTDLVAFPVDNVSSAYSVTGDSPVAKTVVVPFSSPNELVLFIHRIAKDVSNAAEEFAEIVNLRLGIEKLEHSARVATSKLMRFNYRRVSRRPIYTARGVRQRWSQRSERSESRSLVAFLWLILAQLEELTRDWDSRHRLLMNDLSQSNVAAVLDQNALEADDLRSLDLSLIRSAMTESSARHDARVLAAATASGALAALTGTAIGLLA